MTKQVIVPNIIQSISRIWLIGNHLFLSHFSVPRFPDIPGLETFTGKLLHSHDYRHPKDFQDQTLVLLGAGNSGKDIALDLYPHVEKIYLSHLYQPIQSPIPDNLKEVPGIKLVKNKRILFTDGQSVEADALMLCTGYHYDFPFLKPEFDLVVDRNRVTPLYKHVLHTTFPSISFIGITWSICPFPQMSCQVRFAMAALDGTMTLPSKTEMDADTQRDYDHRCNELKMPHRYAHKLATMQWAYNKELLQLANVDYDIPQATIDLYNQMVEYRFNHFMNYKKLNFEPTDNLEGWRRIEPLILTPSSASCSWLITCVVFTPRLMTLESFWVWPWR